ncbi:MAG: MFS transporter [Pseudomonadota bacterium]
MTTQATTLAPTRDGDGLYRYTVYGAVLAGAGLPIYIHAPAFFAETYGVSLAVIGTALFGLRLLDFIQDPLLGWLADNLGAWRSFAAGIAAVTLGAAMVALFAIPAPVDPLIWFIGCLAVLFTAFSFLWILFYARGVSKGESLGEGGPLRLAAWREIGTLLGICLASIIPSVLVLTALDAPLAVFAWGFFAASLIAAWMMAPEWAGPTQRDQSGLRVLLGDSVLRRLLVVGLFNAAPVAVSSSVFLFFVEARLGSETASGPLLLLFFLAAAASAPVWSRVAEGYGTKRTLIVGMALAILTFSFALFLETGDVIPFAIICVAAGASLGADFTLLPALFSHNVDRIKGGGGQAFGLWNFCSKFTLAIAAVTALPILDAAGFKPSGSNTKEVLWTLTILYAGVPLVLKAVALIVLAWTPIEEA